ncbi:MAG TPA: hypothetical protein VHS36_04350, partial [Candidatus Limnocylindrales bacterium]|nr:hypothetical protein [Candidatus Limnocylindrales bacterium]
MGSGAARAVLTVVARGGALFLGLFTVLALVGELRGRATNLSLWWVDLGDLPGPLRLALLASFAGLLIAWAIRREPGIRLGRATA